jgi:aminopeptidase N
VHSLLASRFGEPGGGYLAIVQLRADSQKGWHFNSNQGVFSGGSSASPSTKEPSPQASLGHEIGHLWTQGAGPAASFLREGWATYVESMVLQQEFGAATVQRFWKEHAHEYFQDYDGKRSILEDQYNSNLNYDKGSWVYRMIEEAVGRDGFTKAMTRYSRRSLAGEATWEVLAECFQELGTPDWNARAFLLPWLKEKRAPHLTAQVDGHRVTIRQDEPFFQLPVTVEAKTAQGTERHRVWIRGREAVTEFSGDITEPRVDPDDVLLLRK